MQVSKLQNQYSKPQCVLCVCVYNKNHKTFLSSSSSSLPRIQHCLNASHCVCTVVCFRYSIKINIWPLKSMETMQKLYGITMRIRFVEKCTNTTHSLTPIPSTASRHLQNHFVQHSLKFQSSFSIELNHIIDDFWLWCVVPSRV